MRPHLGTAFDDATTPDASPRVPRPRASRPRRRSVVIACAVAAWLTGGTAAWAAPDTLTIRLSSDIRSTDPGINRDGDTDAVVLHMVEGLVAHREDTSVGPLLARSIETSADGRVHTFRLREGIRFHDGSPLAAQDVLLAWQRYMDPKNNWRCRAEYVPGGASAVAKVEAPDPNTVSFTLEKPSALFLATLARPDCGETAIYARSSLNPDGSWRAPVGTGPYRLAEWRRGEFVDLARNDTYAALPGERDGHTGGKAALVGKVRFLVVPDTAAAKAALLSGRVDILYATASTDQTEFLARKDITVAATPTMELYSLLLQTRDPVLRDVRIRRAIALSLDVDEIARAVMPNARGSRSVIPTTSPYYGPVQAALPKRDLAAAKALLAEAGYKGQPIRLVATKRYQLLYDAAVYMQAMAAEAGINMELEVLDWATELDRFNSGAYQAMSFNYGARLDPTLSFDMVSGPKASQPRKLWDDGAVQALVARSGNEPDPAKRQAVFDELERRFREDVPMVNLFTSVETSAVRASVEGYRGWALNQPRAWGVRKTGSD